jgi:hypothetical protein
MSRHQQLPPCLPGADAALGRRAAHYAIDLGAKKLDTVLRDLHVQL